MTVSRPSDVTHLLASLREGDEAAWNVLLPLIYDELARLAHRQRLRHGAGETLNTTALVHEAYLKLAGKDDASWNDRRHFFRIAARAMRDIVVDYARKQQAAKRGGSASPLSLDAVGDVRALGPLRTEEVLALDAALKELERLDARQARIVELRYFVGLTLAETAAVLDVSVSTVQRAWLSARAWLYRTMAPGTIPE